MRKDSSSGTILVAPLVQTTRIFKTSEKARLRNRLYKLNHKSEISEKMKIWRRNNPDKIKAEKLRWNILNRDKNRGYSKKIRESSPLDVKLQKQKEYEKNKDKYAIRRKINYQDNREDYLNKSKEWQKNNPERRLEIMKRHFEKYGKFFNLKGMEYKWALLAWSDAVTKRDNYTCQVCGKKAEHVHHIFYKVHYPQLSLNINNGIALCSENHKEIHYLAH